MRIMIRMKSYIKLFIRSVRSIPRFIRNPMCVIFFIIGVVPFRWNRLSKAIQQDLFKYKQMSLKQKFWAYKRGFLSERIDRYGLSDLNYNNYMSDFKFYHKSTYQHNSRLYYWYDDKITTYYVLYPFIEYMPIHYCWIFKGVVRDLYNCERLKINSIDELIILLKVKKELAMKPTNMSQGSGFYKLAYQDNNFMINNNEVNESDMRKNLSNVKDSIVTQYVYSHQSLSKIYDKTANSIRVVTIYDSIEGAQVVGAYIKFGTKQTGFVDNASSGGIFAGVNINNGTIFSPVRIVDMQLHQCLKHPDTGEVIAGQIPNWDMIIDKTKEISEFLKNTPYLNYDIVSIEDGFMILEINSHGNVEYTQVFYPFFANQHVKKLFN